MSITGELTGNSAVYRDRSNFPRFSDALPVRINLLPPQMDSYTPASTVKVNTLQIDAVNGLNAVGKPAVNSFTPENCRAAENPYTAPAVSLTTDPSASFRQRSWEDENIYMIMTDRFNDGDKTNDQGCDPANPNRFHGGDWQGVIDKLDYLKDMGITSLWISPPMLQTMLEKPIFYGQDGYHGYWAKDFFKSDPHFGSIEKLSELVAKAHEKGMKVIVDFAFNHTGYESPMSKDPEKQEWFHHAGNQKGTGQWWFEHGSMCGLPDFAQENPECARWLIDMCKWWIDQTGMDGMRLDAVRHVPMKFWKTFTNEIHSHAGSNFLLIGEVYHSDPKIVAPYQEPLDSVFDFPLNFALRDNIGHDEEKTRMQRIKYFVTNVWRHPGESFRTLLGSGKSDMKRIARTLEEDELYRRPDMLVTMVDNHDMTRFVTAAGRNGEEKLKMALSLQFTTRGIPCVYMGTESATPGSFENNRQDIRFDYNPQMQAWFSQLTHLRQDHIALRRGRTEVLQATETTLAYARIHPQETMVMAFNNSGETKTVTVKVPEKMPEGTMLHDCLGENTCTIEKGLLTVTLPPLQSAIFAPVNIENAPSECE